MISRAIYFYLSFFFQQIFFFQVGTDRAERILEKRTGESGFQEYLFRWQGAKEPSWTSSEDLEELPLVNFRRCSKLIGQFERRRRAKKLKSFAVEAILDRRRTEGRKEYLILWKGHCDPTWEPPENLSGSKNLLKKFNSK